MGDKGRFADEIATLVLAKFDELPAKSKPAKNASGIPHWVPLSGIVVTRGELMCCEASETCSVLPEDGPPQCIALATGMKCLPANRLKDAGGKMLHDSHAEILALRCLNHFLVEECRSCLANKNLRSPCVSRNSDGEPAKQDVWRPFAIRKSVRFHMYSSTAPCGDASMELIMKEQEDSTPWPVPPVEADQDRLENSLKGRGSFSELGVVRRKPARADSPLSFSKSCSDKLAMRQCTSLLSSLTSILISPENAYLSSLIVPQSEYIQDAYTRSFSQQGRMGAMSSIGLSSEYSFQPFESFTTKLESKCSKRQLESTTIKPKGSNISALWNPYVQETVINGVLQGWKHENPRCASSISRKRLTEAVFTTLSTANFGPHRMDLDFETYSDFKNSKLLGSRRQAKDSCKKQALIGWKTNVEDSFNLHFEPSL